MNKWVKFKMTYTGPAGIFPKDLIKNLSQDQLDRIGKQYYEVTCAPWDTQKSGLVELQEEIIQAKEKYDSVVRQAERLDKTFADIHAISVSLDKKLGTEGSTERDKFIALESVGKSMVAEARAGLMHLDVEDQKQRLEGLKKPLGEKEAELKAKAEADAKKKEKEKKKN